MYIMIYNTFEEANSILVNSKNMTSKKNIRTSSIINTHKKALEKKSRAFLLIILQSNN